MTAELPSSAMGSRHLVDFLSQSREHLEVITDPPRGTGKSAYLCLKWVLAV
jgi:hypothetical protein